MPGDNSAVRPSYMSSVQKSAVVGITRTRTPTLSRTSHCASVLATELVVAPGAAAQRHALIAYAKALNAFGEAA